MVFQFPKEDNSSSYAKLCPPIRCPYCEGPAVELGQLGNRLHFRCRDCGVDFSRKAA